MLAQIQGLDANLERAVDAYNLANEKLARIESDLRENKLELQLGRAQPMRGVLDRVAQREADLADPRGAVFGLDDALLALGLFALAHALPKRNHR